MTDSNESGSLPTVLIVDDEHDLADLYATWLTDQYTVQTAYGGEDALTQYGADIDVVLLDRRMPDFSGDDVLRTIRDHASNCQVIMVTAVTPDFDVLDMGFDGYVTKPVNQDELQSLIAQVLTRRQYSQQVQTYYQLLAKRAALAAEKSRAELATNDQFTALTKQINHLETEVDTTLGEFTDTDFEAALRKLNEP